ncbi:hypothetical protein [Henriciella marina]|uniref:hypothetical protein n=1 Tax=Henriciella marina TaxID=453851 RepID=UPI000372D7A9|nr:hypothetical protein [Henriciella marina]
MKRLAISLTIAALSASAAFADSMTLKFDSDTGNDQEVMLYDDGTLKSAAGEGTYTYDEATAEMCVASETYNGCITFASPGTEVGDTSAYTGANGASGTATIIAVGE